MKKVEVLESWFNELELSHKKYVKHKVKFESMDKEKQELLNELERYRKALNLIAWNFEGGVSPQAMQMIDIARKAL